MLQAVDKKVAQSIHVRRGRRGQEHEGHVTAINFVPGNLCLFRVHQVPAALQFIRVCGMVLQRKTADIHATKNLS